MWCRVAQFPHNWQLGFFVLPHMCRLDVICKMSEIDWIRNFAEICLPDLLSFNTLPFHPGSLLTWAYHLAVFCLFYPCLHFLLDELVPLFAFSIVDLRAGEITKSHSTSRNCAEYILLSESLLCYSQLFFCIPFPARSCLDTCCYHFGVFRFSIL